MHLFISLLIFLSCSSGIKESERWEGLKNGRLRVYARDSMEDVEGDKDFVNRARKKLIRIANDRAIHLLISYIRANIKNRSSYNAYDNDILTVVKKAVLKFEDCNDDYCEAFTDYDTVNLIEKINTAAKNERTPLSKKEEKEKILER